MLINRKTTTVAISTLALMFCLTSTTTFATDKDAGAAVADAAKKVESISIAKAEEGKSALAGIAKKAEDAAAAGSLKDLVNINSANTDMLASIPGIGPQVAESITKYRDAHGKFSEIKDLLNVDGIDMSLLEKIKPFLQL